MFRELEFEWAYTVLQEVSQELREAIRVGKHYLRGESFEFENRGIHWLVKWIESESR
jgi:hypothetical protein